MERKIIAVDFDGTLFTDDYPNVGVPIWKTINWCKRQKQIGNILILWTCRNGKDLIEALSMCQRVGLIFDYVNSNTIENLKKYGKQDNRKIYADIYLDDKALNVKDL